MLLHDPQTAGLIPVVQQTGAKVVWRCHVGIDTQNEPSLQAWEFLRPYLEEADAYRVLAAQFAPPWIPHDRISVIPPSIDPFSAKNEPMEPDDVARVLTYVGLLAGGPPRAVESLHPPRRHAGFCPPTAQTCSRGRRPRPMCPSCSKRRDGTR